MVRDSITGEPILSATIYAVAVLAHAGDSDDSKAWDSTSSGSWVAYGSVATWPQATHVGGGLWRYTLATGATSGRATAAAEPHVTLRLTDDPTGAAETATSAIHYEPIVSATRGYVGSSVPAAAADAAGGLPISDAGGLDLDAILARLPAALVSGRISADVGSVNGSASILSAAENDGSNAVDLLGALREMLGALLGVTSTDGTVLKTPSGNATLATVTMGGANDRDRTTIVLTPDGA